MIRQKSFENENSTLYLVATPIGNLEEMTIRAVNTLRYVDYIAAEDTRNTGKLLKHFDIKTRMIAHHDHNKHNSVAGIISLMKEGKDIAFVSDAGYPAISDPGYELVASAINNNFNVVTISGANAALNALVNSGILPQPFLFYGFLNHSQSKRVKELESLKSNKETIILYESPHRIKKTLIDILNTMGDRYISLARELTKKHEEIIRGNCSEIIEICDELRGEMVIIISGNENDDELEFDLSIKEHVDSFISEGLSTKDAIKKVAKLRGVNKNTIYNEYHS